MPHVRIADRPVHPECSAHYGGECNCSPLWREWTGDPSSLDRLIDATTTRESRRRSRLTGTQLDLFEFQELDEDDDSLSGYWSEAEFLRTMRDSRALFCK